MSQNPAMDQSAMRATLETAKALVGAAAGQAALECFVPQFLRREGAGPHDAHIEAAKRIAERCANTFKEAMSEEAPIVRNAIAADLSRSAP